MNRKKYLFCFIFVAFLLSIFCSANAEAHPITLTSRLQLVTFQSDFVTFDWTFSVNETIPSLNVSLVIPIDVVNGSLAHGFESAPVEGNVDTSNNVTTFSIDYPLPIASAGGAFPNDSYNATYYVGCNFLSTNQNLHFGADIPGPTDNYQASWSLDSYPEFTQKLQSEFLFPPSYGSVGNETLWMKLDLTIFHRQPFQQYLGTLVNTVPAGLEVFALIMAVALFLPLIYDACRHRLLKPRMVHLIEVVLIPISSAVILFVPIYILALQPFTAPLLIPSLESNLVNLLFLYLVILGVGIVFLAAFSYFRRYLSNGDADDSSHKSET